MKTEKRKLTEEEILYKKTMLEECEMNKMKSEFEIERLNNEIERIRKMQEKDFFIKQLVLAIHQEQNKIRNYERNIKILTKQIRDREEEIMKENGNGDGEENKENNK